MPSSYRTRQTPITKRMAEDMLVRNLAVRALRFLYTVTIPRPWSVAMIPVGKRPKKLPTALGQEEVHDLIQCVAHPKHRAVLLTSGTDRRVGRQPDCGWPKPPTSSCRTSTRSGCS